MSVHSQPFEGAGKTYLLKSVDPALDGSTLKVEDYWDRVMGSAFWSTPLRGDGSAYTIRQHRAGLPSDEEIVYGRDPEGVGHTIHVRELGEQAATTALTITDDRITLDGSRHTAYLRTGQHGSSWRVSWLPGRNLDRNAAITAMTIAESLATTPRPLSLRDQTIIGGYANELGLTLTEALTLAREA